MPTDTIISIYIIFNLYVFISVVILILLFIDIEKKIDHYENKMQEFERKFINQKEEK